MIDRKVSAGAKVGGLVRATSALAIVVIRLGAGLRRTAVRPEV
jgi:hypothetical protein